MRDPVRVVGVVGLVLVAAVALFPPRKAWIPIGGNVISVQGVSLGHPYAGSRAFLFGGGLYRDEYRIGEGAIGMAAEVDAGRLVAEIALVVVGCAAAAWLLSRPGRRAGPGNLSATGAGPGAPPPPPAT
jgi:hypothetical protein